MKYNPIIWLSKFLLPTEKNIPKNKEDIMKSLFVSEFKELTTEESIKLFNEIEKDFYSKLSQRYIDAQIVVADIEKQFKEKEMILNTEFANLNKQISNDLVEKHPNIETLIFERKN